jgi:hypothetical protein
MRRLHTMVVDRIVAYVAARQNPQDPQGGMSYAPLPSKSIPLPDGWQWSQCDGEVETVDFSEVIKSNNPLALAEKCRELCVHYPELESII